MDGIKGSSNEFRRGSCLSEAFTLCALKNRKKNNRKEIIFKKDKYLLKASALGVVHFMCLSVCTGEQEHSWIFLLGSVSSTVLKEI